MQLKYVMTTSVSSVSPNDSVLAAVQIMKNRDVGAVPVCENKEVKGMLTDRDIIIRGLANNTDIGSVKVKDIMTEQVIVGKSDMEIADAATLMAENQVRRLPIIEHEKLAGIVSLADVADHCKDSLIGDTIQEISE